MTLNFKNIYFIGIGGIGMSALARFFISENKKVAGYDRVETQITKDLQKLGAKIHFDDNIKVIDKEFLDNKNTLVIYTPAIPNEHSELNYFKNNDFKIYKRAKILGEIANQKKGIAVAGTHGKTTISSMIAHILKISSQGCNAFLGGIVKNYDSNFILTEKSENIVVEADEFDRSFLQLFPYAAVISSIDADHLDIYGDKNELINSFNLFANQVNEKGFIVVKDKIFDKIKSKAQKISYSLNNINADVYAENVKKQENNLYTFDCIYFNEKIKNISLGFPGLHNIENAIAAITVTKMLGVKNNEIYEALKIFSGIKRRFDLQINSDKIVFIDDYAHHPEELKSTITSVKNIYENKKITGIFQPHLYSRTKDFADGFADALAMLDEIILLDIYPARELPIEGVTSKIIFDKIKNKNKKLVNKNDLLNLLKNKNDLKVLVMLGAGDIDQLVEPVKQILIKNYNL